jgi:DNA-binding NarL/FixJ family response regulator
VSVDRGDVYPSEADGQPAGGDLLGTAGVSTVRVVVVDDQALFRTAARAVVERTPGFRIVAEAGNGAEALDVVADIDVDLVLMDIKMPVMDGISASARLATDHPGVCVFLVSSHDRSSLPDGLDRSGAVAFLPKEELSPQVLAELWAAHAPTGAPGAPAGS